MKQIVLATNNEYKIKEISSILKGLPLAILSRSDFNRFPNVAEDGKTLEDNAIIKAKAIFLATKIPSLADDSGLEVPALGGRPGVNSARYAGPGCTFRDNNLKLLKEMENFPDQERGALFKCVIAICFAENDLEVVTGKLLGQIAREEKGTQGFGYDPIFYQPFYKKTLAELSPEEKNKISHRAIAIHKAREVIIRRFDLKIS